MSDTAVQPSSENNSQSSTTQQTDQISTSPSNASANNQSNDAIISQITTIKASLESQLNAPESSSAESSTSPPTNQAVLDLLNQLDSFTPSITQAILASTQIGITVNKISKSKPPQSTEVKDKAKSLVATWKNLVAPKSATKTPEQPKSTLAKSDSSARTPSPPAASPAKPSPVKSAQPSKSSTSQSLEAQPTSSAKRKAPASVDVKSDKDAGASKKAKTDSATQPTTPANKAPVPSTPVSASSSPSNKEFSQSSSGEYRLGKTGNEIRNKIQKSLFEAIGGGAGDWEVELACRIEAAMWSQYKDANAAYKTKYRELAMNLKDPSNPDLNDALLAGAWSPEQIVTMSSKELASQSLKEQREKDAKWEMAAARSDLGKLNGLTDMFRCGKCKERKCTYYQMQTRSADEPMTVFVRCTVCGNRWKC